MRGTAWRLYLGAGALATGVYYLLPAGAGAVLNVVVGASAVAAIAAGVHWHRPGRRAAWWLIAAAQGLFVAGDALFSVNELVLKIEPFPSLADALYLPGYPALAAGLALLALSRTVGRDWAGLTDAAVIAIGFGLLSWVLVMDPYFSDPSLGLVELLVSLAYPVGDVLLLALAARLATTPGRRTAASRLLIASLAVTMAADTLFSVLALSGAPTGSPTACTWSPTCCWARPGCTRRWPGCPSRPGGGWPGWGGAGCSPWGRPPWSPRPCWSSSGSGAARSTSPPSPGPGRCCSCWS
jgi:hypothetical protein